MTIKTSIVKSLTFPQYFHIYIYIYSKSELRSAANEWSKREEQTSGDSQTRVNMSCCESMGLDLRIRGIHNPGLPGGSAVCRIAVFGRYRCGVAADSVGKQARKEGRMESRGFLSSQPASQPSIVPTPFTAATPCVCILSFCREGDCTILIH